MFNAAIITIYDPSPNYGNKLQNYASKVILEKYGFNVDTLISEPQPDIQKIYLKYLLNGLCGCKLRGHQVQLAWKKFISFYRFNQKYLNPSAVYIDGTLEDSDYDYYVIGSDQVWNPAWYDSYKPKKDLFLLTFAQPKQMLCMSPSFGVSSLPDSWNDWFSEKLSRFPKLNVREDAGRAIIKQLTYKDAEVTIDPTLMLDADEWKEISSCPNTNRTKKPYLLTYFLGTRSHRVNQDIDQIAEEYHLNVCHLNDYSQPDIFVSGPGEFIHLISNAAIILTDSFHACVFSFLFSKPFLVYARNGEETCMMSRIDTLLRTLSLERKYVDSGLENDLMECDYTTGNDALVAKRNSLYSYFDSVFEK